MGSEIIYLFIPVAAVLAAILSFLAFRKSTRRYAVPTLAVSLLIGSAAALDSPPFDIVSFCFWFVLASAVVGPFAYGKYFSTRARQSSDGTGRT